MIYFLFSLIILCLYILGNVYSRKDKLSESCHSIRKLLHLFSFQL